MLTHSSLVCNLQISSFTLRHDVILAHMEDILKQFIFFLTDTNKHFSTKAGIIVAVILGVLLANNLFGFTYYYNIHNKSEKIKEINELLKDSTITGVEKSTLINIRSEVLYRQTIVEIAAEKIADAYSYLKTKTFHKKQPQQNTEKPGRLMAARNNFWFLMSTSGLYIIVLLIAVPAILLASFQSGQAFNALIGAILIIAIFYSISAFFYYAFGLIPRIAENWAWNYVLNFVLQITLTTLAAVGLHRIKQ
jgi:hypothetical protein